MENYICLTIQVPEQEQECLIYTLSEHGAEGFEQMLNQLKAYFQFQNFSEMSLIPILKNYNYQIENIPPYNWNQEWEKNFPMVTIDGICEIYASHHKPTFSQPYSIQIQPQMSFGTGHHHTTQLMIKLLNEWNCKNKILLDMGAGTGILGIFSLLKKAKKVTFIDIEKWAVENIKDNLKLNQLTEQKVICGDHLAIQGKFDAILANIQKNILLLHAETYSKHLKTNGTVFLSGFFDFDEKNILERYSQLGFSFVKRIDENGWIALQLQKYEN